MSTLKTALALLALIAVIMALPVTSHAATWSQRTTITFKQPVEIVGKILEPGTYIFEVSPEDDNVVRIYDKDRILLATLMTAPSYRNEAKDETVILAKGAPGRPATLSAWFAPGQALGREFVYTTTPSEKTPSPARIAADVSIISNGALDLVHRSDMFFTEPVEIPGMTLSPGGYVFKFSDLSRNVLEVWDARGTTLLTSVLTTSTYRIDTDSKNVVFEERPAGTPRALSVWFESGSLLGHEFVYSGAAPGAK